ncbi:plasmid stability protein [Palleronia aestuarii]|uniref:Plasmid stability protein n=1 Tax=Palleronia aestuarii TaxID=568105 RepID=A0A2W7MUH2_9RHOB|nr:plasmid stabilization protein [Palleronia aestuarii]PZX11785.1 plasmid stability protein [Palleronia aestuarii]
MASLTIRNLDDAVKQGLRVRAAEHGRSMEEEARDILRRAVKTRAPTGNLGLAIHRRFASQGGVDLDLPDRSPVRETPTFD